MSAFQTFKGYAAAFEREACGETILVAAGGAAALEIKGTVFRDELNTRKTDNNQRQELPNEVKIAMVDYPDGSGAAGAGGGIPAIGKDVVHVKVRRGDAVYTPRTVSRIIGQAGGSWHLGLD